MKKKKKHEEKESVVNVFGDMIVFVFASFICKFILYGSEKLQLWFIVNILDTSLDCNSVKV